MAFIQFCMCKIVGFLLNIIAPSFNHVILVVATVWTGSPQTNIPSSPLGSIPALGSPSWSFWWWRRRLKLPETNKQRAQQHERTALWGTCSPARCRLYLRGGHIVGHVHDFVVVDSKTFDLCHHWRFNSGVSDLIGFLIDKHPSEAHTLGVNLGLFRHRCLLKPRNTINPPQWHKHF